MIVPGMTTGRHPIVEAQIACTHGDYACMSAFGVAVPTPTAVGVHKDQVDSAEIDVGTAMNF
jgi:hypothetical protein